MSSVLSRVDRKEWIMASVVRVRGPFQVSQGGCGSSWGRWYMMSDESRWGIFWRRHDENICSLVCGSVMDSDSVSMHLVTVDVHLSKNPDANLAEPTRWPRRRHPSVSSTGRVMLGLEGSRSLEKVAIEVARERRRFGSASVIAWT